MAKEICATFKNGDVITYTMAVFEMLKDEKDLIDIYDAETGEILYVNERK